jgi:hypothetical protein
MFRMYQVKDSHAMPSSSANANSSLRTNIEISHETNTTNPHKRKSTATELAEGKLAPNKELFPDHQPSICHSMLVGVGSIWPTSKP